MPKFPEPPPITHLARISPETVTLPAGTELWRLYFRGGPHPTVWNMFRAFGPTSARFDHHLPPPRLQRRQILYAARFGPTTVAEVFQASRLIDRQAKDPWLVCFRLVRAVRLLDLSSQWPTRAGASLAINSGPRPRAQRWSRAIYAAYPDLEGIWYPSSMDAGRLAVALYERAGNALPVFPAFHRSLADPSLLAVLRNIAADLGYSLV